MCFHLINQVEFSEYEDSAYEAAERLSLLDAVHFLQAAWADADDQVRGVNRLVNFLSTNIFPFPVHPGVLVQVRP